MHRPSDDTGVGEEDIQPAIPTQRVFDDLLDLGLLRGVKLPRVDFDGGEGCVDLLLVRLQVRAVVVADVDGFGAALCVLVGCGSADAQGGVCSYVVSVTIRE